jgi:hypothetical protein
MTQRYLNKYDIVSANDTILENGNPTGLVTYPSIPFGILKEKVPNIQVIRTCDDSMARFRIPFPDEYINTETKRGWMLEGISSDYTFSTWLEINKKGFVSDLNTYNTSFKPTTICVQANESDPENWMILNETIDILQPGDAVRFNEEYYKIITEDDPEIGIPVNILINNTTRFGFINKFRRRPGVPNQYRICDLDNPPNDLSLLEVFDYTGYSVTNTFIDDRGISPDLRSSKSDYVVEKLFIPKGYRLLENKEILQVGDVYVSNKTKTHVPYTISIGQTAEYATARLVGKEKETYHSARPIVPLDVLKTITTTETKESTPVQIQSKPTMTQSCGYIIGLDNITDIPEPPTYSYRVYCKVETSFASLMKFDFDVIALGTSKIPITKIANDFTFGSKYHLFTVKVNRPFDSTEIPTVLSVFNEQFKTINSPELKIEATVIERITE